MCFDTVLKITKYVSENYSVNYTLISEENTDGERIFSVYVEKAGIGISDKVHAEDISRDRESAEKFLYLISSQDVEPCHLYDILYDMMPI